MSYPRDMKTSHGRQGSWFEKNLRTTNYFSLRGTGTFVSLLSLVLCTCKHRAHTWHVCMCVYVCVYIYMCLHCSHSDFLIKFTFIVRLHNDKDTQLSLSHRQGLNEIFSTVQGQNRSWNQVVMSNSMKCVCVCVRESVCEPSFSKQTT